MKSDTRVAGPYEDKHFKAHDKPVMTWQLSHFMPKLLRQFQQWVCIRAQTRDDRKLIFLRDKPGPGGKSIFVEFMNFKGIAAVLPPFDNFVDFAKAVHCIPVEKRDNLFVDVPKGLSRKMNAQFFFFLRAWSASRTVGPSTRATPSDLGSVAGRACLST